MKLRSYVPVLVAACCLAAGSTPLPAQDPPPERAAAGGDAEASPVPRVPSPFQIDGVLDEPAWETALRLELPYEVNPGDNLEARVRTEAFVAYDDSRVYAA